MRDDKVRSALERLSVPPEPPGFIERLWSRVEQRERTALRRWRLIGVAACALGIAGAASAGVLAIDRARSVVVDRTLSCPAPRGVLDLFTHVKGPSVAVYQAGLPSRYRVVPHPALVELDAGRFLVINAGVTQVVQTTYAGAYAGTALTQKAGYTLDGSVCRAASPIPLASRGLRSSRVFTGTQGAGVAQECPVANPATFRVRVTLAKSGLPVAVKLALRGGTSKRPVAYVDWTPGRVRAWLAPGCHLYTELAP